MSSATATAPQVEILSDVTSGRSEVRGSDNGDLGSGDLGSGGSGVVDPSSSSGRSMLSGSEIQFGFRRRWVGVAGLLFAMVVGWSVFFGASASNDSEAVDREPSESEVIEDASESSSRIPGVTTRHIGGGVEECIVVGIEESEGQGLDGNELSDGDLVGNGAVGNGAGGNEMPWSGSDAIEAGETQGCRLMSTYELRDSEGELVEDSLLAAIPPLILVMDDHLHRVDLATATAERSELMVSRVLLRTRTHLVLYTSQGTLALRVDDFGGESLLLTDERDVQVMPGPNHSSAWLVDYGSINIEFRLVDLETGAVLQTADPEQGGLDITPYGAGLVNESGSGVYEKTDGGYRRFSEGWVVASTDTITLIRRCDEKRDCGYVWLGRADGNELGYPEFDPGGSYQWGLRISDGDNWISHVYEDLGRLYEIETGRVVELESVGRDGGSEYESSVQISADGIWAVYPDIRGHGITVVDLRTEVAYAIETDTRVGQVFFAPFSARE